MQCPTTPADLERPANLTERVQLTETDTGTKLSVAFGTGVHVVALLAGVHGQSVDQLVDAGRILV